MGEPVQAGDPIWKSTRRAFLRFRTKFVDPPNPMIILWFMALQAKLPCCSLRRKGGGKMARKINSNKQQTIYSADSESKMLTDKHHVGPNWAVFSQQTK